LVSSECAKATCVQNKMAERVEARIFMIMKESLKK
jgi:hypothetical protein